MYFQLVKYTSGIKLTARFQSYHVEQDTLFHFLGELESRRVHGLVVTGRFGIRLLDGGGLIRSHDFERLAWRNAEKHKTQSVKREWFKRGSAARQSVNRKMVQKAWLFFIFFNPIPFGRDNTFVPRCRFTRSAVNETRTPHDDALRDVRRDVSVERYRTALHGVYDNVGVSGRAEERQKRKT